VIWIAMFGLLCIAGAFVVAGLNSRARGERDEHEEG
jgi:hypothetical protein